MSKFRVGQRVRIKWSRTWPELGGREGVIERAAEDGVFDVNGNPHRGDWHVIPDGHTTSLLPCKESQTGTCYFTPREEQLEPATDCYDKTEWDACVWKPEHLRVGA